MNYLLLVCLLYDFKFRNEIYRLKILGVVIWVGVTLSHAARHKECSIETAKEPVFALTNNQIYTGTHSWDFRAK